MSYDQKTLEEFRKYGAVTCDICKIRNRKNWNIYSANTYCSDKCATIAIGKLLDKTN